VTSPEGYLLALWCHECQRVFADKLVCLEDKAWVGAAVADLAKQVRTHACLPLRVIGWGLKAAHLFAVLPPAPWSTIESPFALLSKREREAEIAAGLAQPAGL
jgi:hypothetical protein